MRERHIGIVTRNIQKASGQTSATQTSKVSSQALTGAVYFKADTLYDGEYPIPASPSFGFASNNGAGWFWVPKVGDTIIVEIDMSLDNPDPYYVACLYTSVNPLHEDFQEDYPYKMGLITNANHKLIFNDKDGSLSVLLAHALASGGQLQLSEDIINLSNDAHSFIIDRTVGSENVTTIHKRGSVLQFNKFGSVVLTTAHSNFLYLNDEDDEVTLGQKDGNYIGFSADGVVISDKSGKNFISLNGTDTLQVIASADLVLGAQKVTINSGTIYLGQTAPYSVAIGEKIASLFDAHKHMGPTGPTSQPLPPDTAALYNAVPATSFLSSYVKIRSNIV